MVCLSEDVGDRPMLEWRYQRMSPDALQSHLNERRFQQWLETEGRKIINAFLEALESDMRVKENGESE